MKQSQQEPVRSHEILESVSECSGLHKMDVVYLSDVDEDFRDLILAAGRVVYEKPA